MKNKKMSKNKNVKKKGTKRNGESKEKWWIEITKNDPSFNVIINPLDLGDSELDDVISEVSVILDVSEDSLMEKYNKLVILTEKEEIFFREESFTIAGKAGKTLSMVSLDSEIEGITLKGFKYPLSDRYIKRDSSILMSNVILTDKAEIIFKKGKIVVILYI